ncbi:MEDS domain-containing protein [Halopiger goleimassiliensis]|uniref:MEDS domain-containing protein n=1 Tax=Halopiger goleimassiliensis TaxID=1293048 RepID=UPI0009DBC6F5|nr:MEDS domain-containing protein [Halopiger goleimassiliensis]
MSKNAPSTDVTGESVTLETGLEAFQRSTEFSGPVEALDGHHCNDHFAHIYETPEEKFEAAVPFVRHGLERGERIMYVVDQSSEADVRAALREGGIDVDAALESGALSFNTVDETYLRNGSFDVDEMIEFYGDTVAEATAEYEALRIVAEMSWIEDDETSIEKFMEYEQKINALFAESESLAICQYDRDLFAPEVIRTVVQTHPHLIYDGAACHNFYYTPPEEFFGDDAPARENDRMLRTLRDRATAKTELQQRERFLEALHDATAGSGRSFEEKVHRLLELGSERFDLEVGYFTQTLDEETFEIVTAVGDHDRIVAGVTDSLCDTYCQKLLAAPGRIAVTDAAEAGWTDDRAYERFGLDAYFATTVHVGGEEYGTLCFASERPRERPYTDAERTFLDLMSQWVEYELERRRREEYLRESYRIASDPSLAFDEKLQALFELGSEQFGLELGAIAKVDPDEDRFEVEYVSDEHEHFEPGLDLPLSETYCAATADYEGVESVVDPVAAGRDDIRVHDEFGMDAYLGTYIEVEGDDDRTFFFVSEEPRDRAFSDDEHTFQRLLGQWVKYELERQQRERFLRESYEITADPDLEFEAKLERLLELGRDWMDLDAAGLTHLPSWDDKFRNEYTVGYGDEGAAESGALWTDPGEGCYCRQVIESDEPVGMADVRGTEWEDDDIYREHGLTCYLGTKVMNGSTPYGTLWVGSTDPREREFSDTERTFLELMGQWVSYEIEREYREQALEASNERLEQFAYAASHDLQEPLRMVSSYLQLIDTQYSDAFDEDGEEFLAFAVDGADRMREMIDGLLAYSRVETQGDPFEPVELDTVLDDVLEDLQLQIEDADAEITAGELPRVEGDGNQLRQVLQNLLENAITYSGESTARIHVDAERRKQEWVISVRDNGIGIDPENQDRIFDIFDRLHGRDEYDGTGIGLALCQRIVERHGGEIWVDSEPGEGSTFSFTLPAG